MCTGIRGKSEGRITFLHKGLAMTKVIEMCEKSRGLVCAQNGGGGEI